MTLRIGTRRSALALAQGEEVRAGLAATGSAGELVPMSTAGDRGAPPDGATAGLKGLWVNDIVRALADGEVDAAVHSAKDLPADDADGIVIAAVPERASPLDVLVTRTGDLSKGDRVGTSSLRRQAQVRRWRPDVRLSDVRGNVDTRLRMLDRGELDALILAAAGLLRLGIVPPHAAPMSIAEMVPAPGQGCLAIQARARDVPTLDALGALDHRESRLAFETERRLMASLGGGCALPLGANAAVEGDAIHLVALVADPDGSRVIRTEVDGTDPIEVAERAAEELRREGADAILAKVRP